MNKVKLLAKKTLYHDREFVTFMSVMVRIPTSILQEFRTHRIINQIDTDSTANIMTDNILSMSANSSRAIPFETMVKNIKESMFYPKFTKNKAGMNGEVVKDEEELKEINADWEDLLLNEENGFLRKVSDFVSKHNLHKQTVNRLIDRWAYTNTILSGTEWDNFFKLRCPKYSLPAYKGYTFYSKRSFKEFLTLKGINVDEKEYDLYDSGTSQNEFRDIAEELYDLYYGEHLDTEHVILNSYTACIPFYEKAVDILNKFEDLNLLDRATYAAYLFLISASLCARISFDKVEEENTVQEHLKRAINCLSRGEWGIAEHQAIAMPEVFIPHFNTNKVDVNLENGRFIFSKEEGVVYTNKLFLNLRTIITHFTYKDNKDILKNLVEFFRTQIY